MSFNSHRTYSQEELRNLPYSGETNGLIDAQAYHDHHYGENHGGTVYWTEPGQVDPDGLLSPFGNRPGRRDQVSPITVPLPFGAALGLGEIPV